MQPKGWYPVPNQPGMKAYWNGTSWEGSPQPIDGGQSQASGNQQNYGGQQQASGNQQNYGGHQQSQGQGYGGQQQRQGQGYGGQQQSQGQGYGGQQQSQGYGGQQQGQGYGGQQQGHPQQQQNQRGNPSWNKIEDYSKKVSMNEMLDNPPEERPANKNRYFWYFIIVILVIFIGFVGYKILTKDSPSTANLPDPEPQSQIEVVEEEPESGMFEELEPLDNASIAEFSEWVIPASEQGKILASYEEGDVRLDVYFLGNTGQHSFFQTVVTNEGTEEVKIEAANQVVVIIPEGDKEEAHIKWEDIEEVEMGQFGLSPASLNVEDRVLEPGKSFIIPSASTAGIDDVVSVHIKTMGIEYVDYIWLME